MAKIVWLAMPCVASANCLELENICLSDTFEFNDFPVNAIHRLQGNLTFESLSHFLIDDTVKCVFFQFKNRTNFWETIKIKQAYNHIFAKLYTKDLGGLTEMEFEFRKNQIYLDKVKTLRNILSEEGGRPECLAPIERALVKGYGILGVLERLLILNQFPDHLIFLEGDYKPYKDYLMDKLEELFAKYKNRTDGQVFVFTGYNPTYVYKRKGVVLPREFKYLKEGSDRVDPTAKFVINYHLLMPFYNKQHKDQNCVPAKDLSLFYKDKGRS